MTLQPLTSALKCCIHANFFFNVDLKNLATLLTAPLNCLWNIFDCWSCFILVQACLCFLSLFL